MFDTLKRRLFFTMSSQPANRVLLMAASLLLLRLLLGWIFIDAGLHKLQMPGFGSALKGILGQWAVHNPYPWYKSFLLHVAIPNVHSLAPLISVGELLVGLSVAFGLLVRVSSVFGFLMTLNFWLACGHTGPAEHTLNFLLMGLFIAMFGSQAGRYWGFDR